MGQGLGVKSYNEFHAWVVLFALSTVGIGGFPIKESVYISKIVLVWMAFSMVVLMYIMEQAEKAEEMGSCREKVSYARERSIIFFWIFVIISIYSGLGALIKVPAGMDIMVCAGGVGFGIVGIRSSL